MLTRLIYASRSAQPLNGKDIEQILNAARRRNLVDGVTGMLCHGNNRFLQYLEGEDASVNAIYERILKDPRHEGVVLIDQKTLERRVFGDWSMGFVDIADLWTQVIVKEATKSDGFLPEKMDTDTALRLIKNLKSSLDDQVII